MYNSNFVNLPRPSGVSVRTGPGYGNKNVDTEQIRMMAGLFKTLLQFAFILVKMECVMMSSGRQGGHQHVIRNSILVKTIPGLSQL